MTGNISDAPAPKYRRSCTIWINKVSNPYCPNGCAHVAGLHMNHTLPTGTTGAWTPDSYNKIGDPGGRTFLLQLWGDSSYQRCRLLSEDGLQQVAMLDFSSTYGGYNFIPVAPGTIRVKASGCRVTLDYVRVFHHLL